jgi:hypothetical protein
MFPRCILPPALMVETERASETSGILLIHTR